MVLSVNRSVSRSVGLSVTGRSWVFLLKGGTWKCPPGFSDWGWGGGLLAVLVCKTGINQSINQSHLYCSFCVCFIFFFFPLSLFFFSSCFFLFVWLVFLYQMVFTKVGGEFRKYGQRSCAFISPVLEFILPHCRYSFDSCLFGVQWVTRWGGGPWAVLYIVKTCFEILSQYITVQSGQHTMNYNTLMGKRKIKVLLLLVYIVLPVSSQTPNPDTRSIPLCLKYNKNEGKKREKRVRCAPS